MKKKMKNIFKDEKNMSGITLIALVLTIVVLLIILSVSVEMGMSNLKEAKVNKLITELGMVNHAVLETYTKMNITGEDYPGVKVAQAGIDVDKVLEDISSKSGQTITKKDSNNDNYFYVTSENGGFENLEIDGAEDEYIVNYQTGAVINYTQLVTEENHPLYMYSRENI